MPGKIIAVLVSEGDVVKKGRGWSSSNDARDNIFAKNSC